jgi:hypothetical protein
LPIAAPLIFGQRGQRRAGTCFMRNLEATARNLETIVPTLVVILLLAGFVVSFVWRLYGGPAEPKGGGVLPD